MATNTFRFFQPLAHRHNGFSSVLYIFADFQFRRRVIVNFKFNWWYHIDWKPFPLDRNSFKLLFLLIQWFVNQKSKVNIVQFWFHLIFLRNFNRIRKQIAFLTMVKLRFKQTNELTYIHSHDLEYFLSIYWIGWSHHFRWLT